MMISRLARRTARRIVPSVAQHRTLSTTPSITALTTAVRDVLESTHASTASLAAALRGALGDGPSGGRLAGKSAIVTGSSSGIGKDVALAFAAEGADIVVNYPTGDAAQAANADAVAAAVRQIGRRALPVACDVGSEADVQAMVERTLAEFGKIDILVNNAGIASSSPVEEMPEAVWDAMMRINLKGVYLCTRAVLPHMYERDHGKIINTASQLACAPRPRARTNELRGPCAARLTRRRAARQTWAHRPSRTTAPPRGRSSRSHAACRSRWARATCASTRWRRVRR